MGRHGAGGKQPELQLRSDNMLDHTHGEGVYVAVYGTLMLGESNHGVLERIKGATYIDDFNIEGGNLYATPEGAYFPYLVLSDNEEDRVKGELWEVPTSALPALDRFEGVPHLYRRVKKFWEFMGPTVGLDYYVYARETPPPHTVLIKSGSWRAYQKGQ